MVRVIAVALLAVILTGCVGRVAFVVAESEKDPLFGFDGVYNAYVDHPGGRQEMGSGWYIDCSATEFSTTFRINASKILWPLDNGNIEGFVNSEGKFRLEQVLNGETKGVGIMMSDGTITLILEGNVSSKTMKGALV